MPGKPYFAKISDVLFCCEIRPVECPLHTSSQVIELHSMIPLPPVVEINPLLLIFPAPVLHLYFNIFMAAVALYYYSNINPNSRPINVPTIELKQEYDFIIVGAGSAGSVMANRLTEVQNWTVLVLEAGGDETAISDTPLFVGALWNTDQDWNYTTTPQTNACLADNEGRCRWPRGRGIGGSSAINALLYVRGNRMDYDNWQALGNPGWGYSSMLPYFLRAEDNRNPKYFQSPYHRTGGFLTVSEASYQSELVPAYLRAATELGFDILDYNGAIQNGFNIAQITSRRGSRCSAGKGYLRPIRSFKNINVAQRAMVSKILINDNTAYGVEFIRENETHIVTAKKEVIISAGSINTPQLLMLSGIGPKRELKKFGIPVIQNLPVGRNLQDHVGVPLVFKVDGAYTINQRVYGTVDALLQYTENQTGPLTTASGFEVLGFFNMNSTGYGWTDMQIHIGSFVPTPQNLNLFELVPLYLHPASRGEVTIQSTDIFTPPLMNPRYFSRQPDFDMLLTASYIAMNLTATLSLQEYNTTFFTEFYTPCQNITPNTEEFLICVIEQYTFTIYHPVGTCRMGSPEDPTTVVNPHLQVHGIQNLRVIDASVMPRITSGNTNAPTIAIAERASDIVKLYWNETTGVIL